MVHTVNETLRYVISLAEDVSKGDVPAAILTVLIEMGFHSHTDGFVYLRSAILIKSKNPGLRIASVYREILEINEDASSSGVVEQAILTSINSAWNERNTEVWEYFFSEHRTGKRGKPTNKEFISQIACFMELWNSHCKEGCCNETGSK